MPAYRPLRITRLTHANGGVLLRSIILCSLLLLSALPCFSTESIDSIPEEDVKYLENLFDMKITSGSFLELNLQKSPFSMTIINEDDIRISGARNMSELLEIFVPGFQYFYNKWNGTLWGMRGISNDRNTKIIYLIDGHKMNTQARDGFQGETVLGLLGDIERVEVLRGPAGLVYGSGAIAGIVNVVTDSKKSDGTHMRTAFGTNGQLAFEADVHTTPAEEQTLSFSAGFRRADGLPAHQSRIYGFGSWPFSGSDPVKKGVPTDGRFGSTDGNMRLSGSWSMKNVDAYMRVTRQKESAGGMFIQDPWPEHHGYPDSTFRSALVDGQTILPTDPFWSGTESWRNNRLVYISDNLLLAGNFKHQFDMNELRFHAGYDLNTTRSALEQRAGYEQSYTTDGTGYLIGTFGERRITGNAVFYLNSIPRLQMASGIEYRLDMIGDDAEGKNLVEANQKKRAVTEINYHTFSLFGEGIYELTGKFDFHFGGRLDFHTRAFMGNPKCALIYKPAEKHSIKLIAQSSSNNGSADNYEYNRFHFRSDGTVAYTPTFPNDGLLPKRSNDIIQPAPQTETMHKLKPEKVYALELAYTGTLPREITLAPSISVGQVHDLFGWSQTLFRVVNTGSYNYFNADFDATITKKLFTLGANHTFQRPVFTNPDKEKSLYKIFTLPKEGTFYDSVIIDNKVHYIPVPSDSQIDFNVNIIKEGVTGDGEHFLNLNTHLTKFYFTLRPTDWFSLHTNLRLFWGLPGRHELYAKDTGFNYWHIDESYHDLGFVNYFKKSVAKKLNISLHFFLANEVEVKLFAYDVLGIDHPQNDDLRNLTINTLRWQLMYHTGQKDLYSTDQQSFGFSVTKSF